LSLNQKIGIGAGVGLGAVALGLFGAFLVIYRRRHPRGGLKGDGKYQRTASPIPQQYTGGYSSSMAGSHQLSDLSWKQNAGRPGSTLAPSAGGLYNARDEQKTPAAGQPLLAELGGDAAYNPHGPPAELAGGTAYHPQPQYGYNAQSTPHTQQPYGEGQNQAYQAYQAHGQQQTQPANGQHQHQAYQANGQQQGYNTHGSFSPPYERSNF
jgi:hypothetical protein